MPDIQRRDFVIKGSAALAGLAALYTTRRAYALPSRTGEEVVAWIDQLPPNPVPEVIKNQLVWQGFDSWITPNEKFFSIAHFNRPVIDAATWKLEIDGLVKNPLTLTLDNIKRRPRQEVIFTVECSGNDGLPFFNGGVGNARWVGTPLAPILKEAGVLDSGIEVVFWGTDEGEITRPDGVKFTQNFARSMTLADAMDAKNILCYEMNGAPLPPDNGFPLRLIAPGWYGIANAKWLKRIEVRDRRFENRFMARDYVTLREEDHNGETVWVETSVGPCAAQISPGPGYPRRRRLPDRRRRLGRTDRQGGGQDRRRAVDAGHHRSQRGSRVRLEDLVGRLVESACRRACRLIAGNRHGRQRAAGDGRSLDHQEAHLLGEQWSDHTALSRSGEP